jgi:DNA modification methylase
MFPLEFPWNILKNKAKKEDIILDPFCGRGTTNFAARILGLNSMGVASSQLAVAITESKLVTTSVDDIIKEAKSILTEQIECELPTGEFWDFAYHPKVLKSLSILRNAFLQDCSTPSRIALRGIILGSLHGPKQKTFQSYFSYQCPRTYDPKPAYAVRYWKHHGLIPESIEILPLIERRAKRYYNPLPITKNTVRLDDSRNIEALKPNTKNIKFNWIITSPPYYKMRTYIADQWVRNWFVGGSDHVDYTNEKQLKHKNPEIFAYELRQVWRNTAYVSSEDATMVIRFGGFSDKNTNPLEIIKFSLKDRAWRIKTIFSAGSAIEGKRQADTFIKKNTIPMNEYDIWVRKL